MVLFTFLSFTIVWQQHCQLWQWHKCCLNMQRWRCGCPDTLCVSHTDIALVLLWPAYDYGYRRHGCLSGSGPCDWRIDLQLWSSEPVAWRREISQSFSWRNNFLSFTEGKGNYCTAKSWRLMGSHTVTSFLSKIHSNIILLSTVNFPQWYFFFFVCLSITILLQRFPLTFWRRIFF